LTASWNSLPDDMIEVITLFLDNGSLHEFAVVSKKSTKIVRKAGKLVRVFVIRPPAKKRILALNHGDRRDGPLLFGGRRSPKFDSYSRLDVYDIRALNRLIERCNNAIPRVQLIMSEVTTLNVDDNWNDVRNTKLGRHLPSLRNLRLLGFNWLPFKCWGFAEQFPSLERVELLSLPKTYRFSPFGNSISPYGKELEEFKNLKVVYLQGVHLEFGNFSTNFRQCADLNDHPDEYLFCQCSSKLERVWIQNVTSTYAPGYNWKMQKIQHMLIKFVRKTPTLTWFRSPLSKKNIDFLRLKRPDIEFLN